MKDKITLIWAGIHKDTKQRGILMHNGDIVYTYKDSEWGKVCITLRLDGSSSIHTHIEQRDIPINE